MHYFNAPGTLLLYVRVMKDNPDPTETRLWARASVTFNSPWRLVRTRGSTNGADAAAVMIMKRTAVIMVSPPAHMVRDMHFHSRCGGTDHAAHACTSLPDLESEASQSELELLGRVIQACD